MDLFGDHRHVFAAVDKLHDHFSTFVMWGNKDEFIPFDNCERILRPAMPHASFVAFDDADHFVFLNRPEDFCDALLNFLDGDRRLRSTRGNRGGGRDRGHRRLHLHHRRQRV